MSIKYKNGVPSNTLKPQAAFGLDVIASILKVLSPSSDLTVTATTDGAHMVGSKHYEGQAFDLRIFDLPARVVTGLVEWAKKILGPFGFDIVLEGDHIHGEYDPKPGRTLFG